MWITHGCFANQKKDFLFKYDYSFTPQLLSVFLCFVEELVRVWDGWE